MFILPRWVRGTALALTMTSLVPLAAQAQTRGAEPVPPSFVPANGDGWTMMMPPDWTFSTVDQGMQQVKGTLPNGAPGTVTVFKATGAPDSMDAPTLAAQFEETDAMKGFKFAGGQDGQVAGLKSVDVPVSGSTGAGYFRAFVQGNTGWILMAAVTSTDSDTVSAGLDSLGTLVGSFSLN